MADEPILRPRTVSPGAPRPPAAPPPAPPAPQAPPAADEPAADVDATAPTASLAGAPIGPRPDLLPPLATLTPPPEPEPAPDPEPEPEPEAAPDPEPEADPEPAPRAEATAEPGPGPVVPLAGPADGPARRVDPALLPEPLLGTAPADDDERGPTVEELSDDTALRPAAEPAEMPPPLATAPPEPTEEARLAAALWSTGRWGARHVAASVVGPGGPIVSVGKASRRFALASVTKILLGYACLVAVEEGTISLDEPAGPPDATVAHLLAHAAGLGFDTGVVLPPGVKRIYSNTGYDALAAHLAERSGMSAEQYLHDAVLEPLAMGATDVPDGSLAHGGWSSVEDLGRFATELLVPTLIHPLTLSIATSPVFPKLDGILPGLGAQSPNDWGLGFELRDNKHPHWTGATNSPSTFGHFGAAGTFLWVDPAIDRALVVLTDRSFGPWALEAWPPLADAVVAARLAV